MSSIALALKYRPTCFGDLIGQNAVSQTLSLALDSKHISHAYLFSGLRGSGKTSSARIFARALQCEKGPSSQPCGECACCLSALENRHMDIIEMDAASSRGIDDIKRLIEQTKYRPSFARYKIFIIDEVHMLSKEAFNALLKTLEEPPEFVKFILATTDPLRLPPTILSRTQHFRFKQIPHKLVVEHIANILQKEGVSYEPEALEIIARSGSGSLRDTLTLLDQAIIFCKNHIKVAGVSDMLGVVDPQVLSVYFASILQKDDQRLHEQLQILSEYECEMILDEMMLFLKNKLLQRDAEFPALLIDRFSRILSDSKVLLSLNTDGAFVLLLSAMKMQEAMKVKDIESMIEELEGEVFGMSLTKPPMSSMLAVPSASPLPPATSQAAQDLPQSVTLASSSPAPSLAPVPEHASVDSVSSNLSHVNNSWARNKFSQLIAKLKDRSLKLGKIFERNIIFVDFKDGVLSWQSKVQGEDKAFLKEHFSIIKAFVSEIYGEGTAIQSTQDQMQNAQSQVQNSTDSGMSLESHNLGSQTHMQSQVVSESATDMHPLVTHQAPPSDQEQSQESTQANNPESAHQSFLAQNRDLINAINESVGIKDVIHPAGSTRA